MNRINPVWLFLIIIFSISGCKKSLEIDNPIDQLISGSIFQNESTANSAVAGVYSTLLNNTFAMDNSIITLVSGGMSADELYQFQGLDAYVQFLNNSVQPANDLVTRLWADLYNIIYHANAVVEGVEGNDQLSMAARNQFSGEVRFIRDFCYFYLINFFGDVPLLVTTDIRQTNTAPRTPKDEIYQFLKTDLAQAISLLPSTYPTSGKGRVNKAAASALLARVYLYTGDWANAEVTAAGIIGSSMYNLPADLNKVFVKSSTETIWYLDSEGSGKSGYTADGYLVIPGSSTPNYVLTDRLLNSFEPNDQRKSKWTDSITYSGMAYYYPYKYKLRGTPATSEAESYVMLRLAEQYLVRGEAKAKQDKIEEAVADINVVRQRAGLGAISMPISKDSCLVLIEKERRAEFMAELGHLWFDLNRTNRSNAVLGAYKPFWEATDMLLPIPLTQIQRNPNLIQNPGY